MLVIEAENDIAFLRSLRDRLYDESKPLRGDERRDLAQRFALIMDSAVEVNDLPVSVKVPAYPINPAEWTREDRRILQKMASRGTDDHDIRAGMKIYSDYIASLNT